jgi:hypothetical protein
MDFAHIVDHGNRVYSEDLLSTEDKHYLLGYKHGYEDAVKNAQFVVDEEETETLQGKLRSEIMNEVIDFVVACMQSEKAQVLISLIENADYIVKGDNSND